MLRFTPVAIKISDGNCDAISILLFVVDIVVDIDIDVDVLSLEYRM